MKQINNKNITEEFNFEIFSNWFFDKKYRIGWEEMIANHYQANIFLTIEWLELWWKTYAQKSDVLKLIFIQKKGVIIAVAPFYQKGGKELRFIGTGELERAEVASEFLDILIDDKYKSIAIKLLSSYLEGELKRTLSFEFNNVLITSNIYDVTKAMKKTSWQTNKTTGLRFIIDLPSTFQEYIQSIDKSMKSQLLRKKKKFEKLGGEIKRISNEKELIESFENLKALHSQRWNKRGLEGAFSDKRFITFHIEFMRFMLKKDQLSLTSLMINKEVIAVIYNMKYRDTRFFYQMGANLNFRPNISAGSLLHLYEIQDSIDQGENYYDFMKGARDNSYKTNFIKSSQEVLHISIYKKGFANLLQLVKYDVLSIKHKIIKCLNIYLNLKK